VGARLSPVLNSFSRSSVLPLIDGDVVKVFNKIWLAQILMLLLPMLFFPTQFAIADESKEQESTSLKQLVGTIDKAKFLSQPAVRQFLQKLPAADRARITSALATTGVIESIGNHVLLRGIEPQRGGEREAAICISVSSAAIYAGNLIDESIYVYSTVDEYTSLPDCIRMWISYVKSPARMAVPEGLKFVRIK